MKTWNLFPALLLCLALAACGGPSPEESAAAAVATYRAASPSPPPAATAPPPAPTRPPSPTPTDAPTPAAAPAELSVRMLDQDEAQRVAEVQDVPFLAQVAVEQYSAEQLTQAGTTLAYTIYLIESSPLSWGMGWCTASEETLAQNMEHTQYTFFLNGRQVPRNEFVEVEYYSERSQAYCHQCYTVLTDWSPGEHLIRTLVEFDQPINDGWDDYAAGTTTYEYRVIVSP